VGLGGSLADRKTVAAGAFDTITERARRIAQAVAAWRARPRG
jgi:hypothetical protein